MVKNYENNVFGIKSIAYYDDFAEYEPLDLSNCAKKAFDSVCVGEQEWMFDPYIGEYGGFDVYDVNDIRIINKIFKDVDPGRVKEKFRDSEMPRLNTMGGILSPYGQESIIEDYIDQCRINNSPFGGKFETVNNKDRVSFYIGEGWKVVAEGNHIQIGSELTGGTFHVLADAEFDENMSDMFDVSEFDDTDKGHYNRYKVMDHRDRLTKALFHVFYELSDVAKEADPYSKYREGMKLFEWTRGDDYETGPNAFFGKSMTEFKREICDRADSLESEIATREITVPDGITKIPDCAFAGLDVSTVNIPASVEMIGAYAFANSSVENINFAEGSRLKTLGKYMCESCNKLKYLELPEGVCSLQDGVFYNCRKFEEFVAKGDIEYVGDNALSGCYRLKRVDLSKTKYIGSAALLGTPDLDYISFPEGEWKCGTNAFAGSGLKRADVGQCVEMGDGAFQNCNRLAEVDLSKVKCDFNMYRMFRHCDNLKVIAMPELALPEKEVRENGNMAVPEIDEIFGGQRAVRLNIIDTAVEAGRNLENNKTAEYKADNTSIDKTVDYGLGE